MIERRAQPQPLLPPTLEGAGFRLAELLAQLTHDGSGVIDPRGALVAWNSAAVAITGWTGKDGIALLSEALRAADRAQNLGGGTHRSAADAKPEP